MKLFFVILLMIYTPLFAQRWIIEKVSGNYITDSTGILITGTATQLKAYFLANMQPEDTVNLTSTTVAPTASSVFTIYQQERETLEGIPFIPQATTDKIAKIQARIQVGDKNVYLMWDRVLNKLVVFSKKGIVYLVPQLP